MPNAINLIIDIISHKITFKIILISLVKKDYKFYHILIYFDNDVEFDTIVSGHSGFKFYFQDMQWKIEN